MSKGLTMVLCDKEHVPHSCYVFLSLALLHTDTSDCPLSSIPHPFIGPMYLYNSILLLQFHLTLPCLVQYLSGVAIQSGLFSCMIYILEPLI